MDDTKNNPGLGNPVEVNTAALRDARITGLLYLGLAVTGMLGFLLIRPRIHVAGDAAQTLMNIIERGGLARAGVLLEMGIVLFQALAAVWFYKIFRQINPVAAGSLAAFGLMNSVAIMASAGFVATAVAVAGDPAMAPGGDAAATVALLYRLSSDAWGVGALFFGLWLVPMGYLASTSALMPVWLGRVLVAGGIGYVLSALASYAVATPPSWLDDILTIPATVGEFWMIGYLLIVGIRRR